MLPETELLGPGFYRDTANEMSQIYSNLKGLYSIEIQFKNGLKCQFYHQVILLIWMEKLGLR